MTFCLLLFHSGLNWYIVGGSGEKMNYFIFFEDYSHKTNMLIGQYSHTIDDKKRLSLPSKWKKIFGKTVVVTRGLDTCLFVYTSSEWKKIGEKLAQTSMGSRDARDLNRFFLSGAIEIDVDTAGRILIPDYLKEFGNLDEKVIFLGLFNRAEIWNSKSWEKKEKQVSENADNVASKLQEIGMI